MKQSLETSERRSARSFYELDKHIVVVFHAIEEKDGDICQCGELAGRNIAVEIHIRLFGKAVTGDMRQHLVAQRAGRDVMPQDEHVGAADLFAHESVAQIAVDVEVVPVAFVAVPRRLA